MLKLENVCKYYQSATNPVKALDNINVNFNLDEFIAITGESGSGKSTFLNVITGMDTYEEGEIYFKGNPTSFFDTNDLEEFRKRHVSYILQNYGLIDSYTVIDNIMLPLLINGVDKKEAKEKAITLIKEVDLLDKINVKVSLLSGGEKQRVSIARALISDKEILACDEITANLDSETSKEIIALVKRLAKGKLVLFVTHDYSAVKDICTRHIVFSDGKIVMDDNITLDDEKVEDLDLNYKPISNKTRFKLAMNNLKACPRKTLFNSMILVIVSFIISLLLLFISININETNSPSFNNSCIITDPYYLLYEPNSNLDLKGNINTRAFMEGYTYIDANRNYTFTTHTLNDDSLISFKGRMPETEKELVMYKSLYTEEINVGDKIILDGLTYTIVGVGHIENYKTIISINPELNKKLYDSVSLNAFSNYLNDIYGDYNGLGITLHKSTTSKSYIKIPADYYGQMTEMKVNNIDLFSICDVQYKTTYGNVIDIYINEEFINTYFDKFVHSVYALDEKDVNYNINNLNKNNVAYLYPNTDVLNDSINRLTSFVIVFIALVITGLLYFVISAIITRLNNSTIKDYSIYRMLGVAKRDNKNIIMYYNLLLSFIIFNIVYFTLYTVFYIKIKLEFNLIIYIIFLLGILLFNYMITKNTTKKVYNTTSIKTLKEE